MTNKKLSKFIAGGAAAVIVASAIIPVASASTEDPMYQPGYGATSSEVISSLKVETSKAPTGQTLLSVDGEYIDAIDNVKIKSDGIYATYKGSEHKISGAISGVTGQVANKRAVRINEGSMASLMHYTTSNAIVLTSNAIYDVAVVNKEKEPFLDVTAGQWSQPYIEEAYNYIFAQGTTATQFSPNQEITRSQFAVMMSRALEIKDSDSYDSYTMTDLSGKWYANNVQFLVDLGVITGYENGTFGGNDKLTRQQAIAILGRTLEYLGQNSKDSRAANVTDYSKISGYAQQYVNYFAKNNVLSSGAGIAFDPNGNLTRAQMAKILVLGLQLTDKY